MIEKTHNTPHFIDWSESVMLRYEWFKNQTQAENIDDLLLREILITITGDDATCFHYLEVTPDDLLPNKELSAPPSPEQWQKRLVARMEWEIKELARWGDEYQDVIGLLKGALVAVQKAKWEPGKITGQAEWQQARDAIAKMEKVAQVISRGPTDSERELTKEWRRWFSSNNYQIK